MADLAEAIAVDAKEMTFAGWDGTLEFGQLALWDARPLLANLAPVAQALSARNPIWWLNLISIKDGRSYFICNNNQLKEWWGRLLGLTFEGDTAVADRLWLRKEVLRLALSDTK